MRDVSDTVEALLDTVVRCHPVAAATIHVPLLKPFIRQFVPGMVPVPLTCLEESGKNRGRGPRSLLAQSAGT